MDGHTLAGKLSVKSIDNLGGNNRAGRQACSRLMTSGGRVRHISVSLQHAWASGHGEQCCRDTVSFTSGTNGGGAASILRCRLLNLVDATLAA